MRVFIDAIILRERSKHYELLVLPLLVAPELADGTAQTLSNNKHNPLKAAHTILTSENMTKTIDALLLEEEAFRASDRDSRPFTST
jgi:hypothetical protein